MTDNFSIYSGLLTAGKWISKADFIYRVKLNCDCAEKQHGKFLEILYQLNFSKVKKDNEGRIILSHQA